MRAVRRPVTLEEDFPFGANEPAEVSPSPSPLDQKFAEYHLSNPHVYDILVKLARQALAAGKDRCSMKALFEVARWHVWLDTSAKDFHLNNNFTSRYARLIMRQEKDLASFFTLRELQS